MKNKQKVVVVGLEKPRSNAERLEEIEKRNKELQIAASGAKGLTNILHFLDLIECGRDEEFSFERCAGGLGEVALLLEATVLRSSDSIEREVWGLQKSLNNKE